jgi:integrase
MPKIKFSAKKIQSLKAQAKSIEYFEVDRKRGDGAFGIRVSPKGLKTWFLMYTLGVKVKRFALGTYPDLPLSDARKRANDTMSAINDGEDPQQGKTDYKSAPTMSDLWMEYQKALARRTKPKAPSNVREEIRKWQVEIEPVIGSLKVQDVKRCHISKLLNNIADRSPTVANRTFALLQIVFKVGLDLGWLSVHPMYMMSKPGGSEAPRKRILSDDEIRVLWPVFSEVSASQGDIFKLQLLTAARSGELMRMKWDDIENGIWIQRDTKTGNDFLVPLSPQALEIVSARLQVSPWVFPSRTGHAKYTSSTRNRIQQKTSITGWTNHDLRRTARTIMSRLQIKQHVRERVLNHSQGGIVGVYDQYDYLNEKADALDKLGREIYRILGISTNVANIIELRRAS